MATVRRMTPTDLFSLNLTNLDALTENYDLHFYLNYLMRWPSLFNVVEDRDGQIIGYIMGKLEAQHSSMRHSEHYTPWHGHITVLTIAPAWRRLGYARRLTESLERVSDINDAWFVDLYVRAGNTIAVGMYKGMGYSVFRRVVNYYSDDPTGLSEEGEDAFDMRKPLSRDKDLRHTRENGENFLVNPEDVY
ncbi:N-acetyltransferase [Paracoccidioides lutzii Pb01]|uniref:N-acetyltransferase n=1 Tax=Paracoccidioides lutzii (strain ATCC MYA-826 / Pb01) TaxID=502779 RepID=C1GQL7_PARBA|nr:N-acetyltransferase [Paracoccidioides lutzii Pb01]EEH37891.1 N-acetyltransferase [Paracoccidioides lutzii Pb01]